MKQVGISHTGSKVILFGEHFVVYESPAIAIPFASCGVEVSVEPQDVDKIISSLYTGMLADSPEIFSGLKELIINTKIILGINEGLLFNIDSQIPLQRGMGSSAAISIGIIKALYDFASINLEYDQVKSLAQQAENVHHQNASGIDIETILSTTPILFQKGQSSQHIESNIKGSLLLVDSTILGATKEAVASVANLFEANPVKKELMLFKYSNVLEKAVKALESHDIELLGEAMNENHDLLKAIHVSHPKIDMWLEYALENNALGAKITGGGLGGCFLVLTNNDKVKEDLISYYENEGLVVRVLEMEGM